MADFTSALFLGMHHPATSMRRWRSLTTGRPAAVCELPDALRVARTIADRQGVDDGLLYHSTLHALIDIFGELVGERTLVAIDEAVYPVTEWASLRAVARGIPIVRYRHHDASSLRRVLAQRSDGAVVVTDGWCAGCSLPAPIAELRRAAASLSALVVDDSLAFGVLGSDPRPCRPFGTDGCGVVRWLGEDHHDVLYVASMAKAFGVPTAVVTGSRAPLEQLRLAGAVRLHCSPPSAADLAAADRALSLGSVETARARLAQRTSTLRELLAVAGLPPVGRSFPMVNVPMVTRDAMTEIYSLLERAGVRALQTQSRCARRPQLTFLVRASHSSRDLLQLGDVLSRLPSRLRRST